MSSGDRQRLLILGTGFGARHVLQRIDTRHFDVRVISPRNHFLFTPLLPSTTVGTVEFRTIIEPIRSVRRGCEYLQGLIKGIDVTAGHVICSDVHGQGEWQETYDQLIVAVGSVTNDFGIPGVEEHAFALKELSDARRIRQRLIENLERASLPCTPSAEVSRLMHFVVVGGGPTGVRFAAELIDLLTDELSRLYRQLRDHIQVTVVDSAAQMLSSYDAHLRDHVQQVFRHRGVQFEPHCEVARVTARGVELKDGRHLAAGMVLWCVGFAPNPLIAALDWQKDRGGRLSVDDRLQVVDHACVYAIGDCAAGPGTPLPQLAQVAAQQGDYLARALNCHGTKVLPPFRWHNRGFSSYIGQSQAVVDAPQPHKKSAGHWAYQSWRVSIWSDLLSWRSRIWIPLDRLRAAVFGRDLSQF